MRYYIALVHKDRDSDFGVSFPDFPGCVTAGSTLDEATTMAIEALAGHIECMVEDGQPIPEPSSIEAIMADPGNRDGIPVLVPMPVAKGRAVRLSITLPEDLLKEMDSFAEREGYTRSGLLAHAVKNLTGGRLSGRKGDRVGERALEPTSTAQAMGPSRNRSPQRLRYKGAARIRKDQGPPRAPRTRRARRVRRK